MGVSSIIMEPYSPPPPAQRAGLFADSAIHQRAQYDIYSDPIRIRKTSIICTIGPKTKPVEKLHLLRAAGMNIVRMNFSHGSYDYHGEVIANTRQMEREWPKAKDSGIGIALDTKGPEIRTGMLASGGDVELVQGSTVTTDKAFFEKCDASMIFVDYQALPQTVQEGAVIFIDDGLIALKVISKSESGVTTEVQNGGMLGSKKGVNLPNINTGLPSLSEKDTADLRWGVSQGIDIVFASFIRSADDIAAYRKVLGEDGERVVVIAKIENHEGIRNFDEILAAADGIMVARGDLGIEIPAEKVFLAQKMMIAKCNLAAKPVICATQMLESMTFNPRPTRAEVSDVANAVLDGSDCVMLSGETAKGDYPVEAIEMMSSVCREAEAAFPSSRFGTELKMHIRSEDVMPESVSVALVSADTALAVRASAIIVLSDSGNSARLLAQFRPRCPIVVVTRKAATSRICHLYHGCYSMLYPKAKDSEASWSDDVEERFEWALALCKERGFAKAGDRVIATRGASSKATDTVGMNQFSIMVVN